MRKKNFELRLFSTEGALHGRHAWSCPKRFIDQYSESYGNPLTRIGYFGEINAKVLIRNGYGSIGSGMARPIMWQELDTTKLDEYIEEYGVLAMELALELA